MEQARSLYWLLMPIAYQFLVRLPKNLDMHLQVACRAELACRRLCVDWSGIFLSSQLAPAHLIKMVSELSCPEVMHKPQQMGA